MSIPRPRDLVVGVTYVSYATSSEGLRRGPRRFKGALALPDRLSAGLGRRRRGCARADGVVVARPTVRNAEAAGAATAALGGEADAVPPRCALARRRAGLYSCAVDVLPTEAAALGRDPAVAGFANGATVAGNRSWLATNAY